MMMLTEKGRATPYLRALYLVNRILNKLPLGLAITFAAFCGIALPWVSAAHATLLSDTVNGTYFFPDTSTVFENDGSQTVNPSASFFFSTGVPNTTATVTATQITLTFDASGAFVASSFNGVVITDLSASNITGVSLDAATNVPGFGAADLSFTADSVSINVQSFLIPSASDRIVVDLSFLSTAVPEPATLALLGGGLLGFAVMLRRRKRV